MWDPETGNPSPCSQPTSAHFHVILLTIPGGLFSHFNLFNLSNVYKNDLWSFLKIQIRVLP